LNWTLQKKIFRYYGRLALGLVVLGFVALVFQTILQKFGDYVVSGNWAALERLLLLTVILAFIVILLLYFADLWYDNIVSRMAGQKGPPKE
jgi:hypothetical protein